MNSARVACPKSSACKDSNCPYNHSRPSNVSGFSGSTVASKRAVEGMTGNSGQYVGSKKGGNAVPVKQTGDLPAFLKSRLVNNKVPTVRSGGNEKEIDRNGSLSHISARPPQVSVADEAQVDWKTVALSRVKAGVLAKRQDELRELISLRDEHRRTVASLEKEIKEVEDSTCRQPQAESDSTTRVLCRDISVRIADVYDRSKVNMTFLGEERDRVLDLLKMIGRSGLADTASLMKEQEQIFSEIQELFDATRRNIEFIGTEFRANASNRLGGPRGN